MINIKNRIMDLGELSNAIAKMQRQFIYREREDSLTTLPTPELSEIIYQGEKIALSCRKAIEGKGNEGDYILEENTELSTKDIPVEVTYNEGILRVKTPLTFKRMYRDNSLKENYMLMNYVDIAIKEYVEKNGTLFDKVDAPFVGIIKRKSNSYHQNKICDNDNLENGRIINLIASAIGHSDNPMVMDIYSCFRLCKSEEETGMEFIFTSYDKFKAIINELDRVA